MKTERVIRVWDLPTRLFHWLLVLLVIAAFISGLEGGNMITVHAKFGYAIMGLLVFRLVWGFIGSTYARFCAFIPTPGGILAYLRGQWHGAGHNPMGALSVFALLAVMIFQVASGLVSNDSIALEGPLYHLVTKSTSDTLTGLHRLNMWLIIALVALHIASIFFYAFVKKHNLVIPMITGKTRVDRDSILSAKGGGWIAFIVAVLIASAAFWYVVEGSKPPPPPPVETPAW